jgi:hypothetical protein
MSKGYRVLRDRSIAAYAAQGPGYRELFLGFEAELLALKQNQILDPLAGRVRLVVNNVCSFHHNPSAFAHNAIRRWRDELEPDLERRGLHSTRLMVDWLTRDLEGGGALAR